MFDKFFKPNYKIKTNGGLWGNSGPYSNSSAASSLRSMLMRHSRLPKVIYTTAFPYSRKRAYTDSQPEWRWNREKYPRFNLDYENQEPVYVVKNKETGTVYYWFTANFMSHRPSTDYDLKILRKEIMPRLKSNEEDADVEILGWDWGFCRKHWVGQEHFEKPGDQYVKFFDEPNILYYFSHYVYEHDLHEHDIPDLEEEYSDKHRLLWEPQNYTKENLGEH